jgi:alpha-galactosidase
MIVNVCRPESIGRIVGYGFFVMTAIVVSGAQETTAGGQPVENRNKPDEGTALHQWVVGAFLGRGQPGTPLRDQQAVSASFSTRFTDAPPFTFTYGGKSSTQLLGRWTRRTTQEPPANGRQRSTVAWSDPETNLEVVCEVCEFTDFPAVEWVLRLKNASSKESPIIEDLRPLDVPVRLNDHEKVVFHYSKGSTGSNDDYASIDAVLSPGQKISLPGSDRVPSQVYLPYFNLEWREGGVVGAIGWTGQWALQVQRKGERELTLQAGQQLTHLKLLPGEAIRTPRILLVHWQGNDRLWGHNLLRRLLIAHYVPRIDGKIVLPLISQSMFDVLVNDTTERTELDLISRMKGKGFELYWLDAGWFEGGWGMGAGNWFPNKAHFPHGLRPLSDAAHQAGLKFTVWFEPERVCANTEIMKEHPQWLLHHSKENAWGVLFNLGNPDARQWMTDRLLKCISDWGIDIYRQDHNFHPLPFWRANDPPDRRGITEIRHMEGLYAMWDELLKRHPGLIIENANWRCTGPDLEVLMRSSGSWTCSENFDVLTSKQPQLMGLSLYIPVHATWLPRTRWAVDPYVIRSAARFGVCFSLDTRAPDFPVEQMKRAIEEIKSLRELYLGDYYPLLDADLNEQHWCGWQFDRPDLGCGFAVLFRRSASPYAACDVSLRGLDPAAKYEVTFSETYDVKENRKLTGQELKKLRVKIGSPQKSVLIRYSMAVAE